MAPGTDQVISLEAHNFGITVINEGKLSGNNQIQLDSKSISRMSTSSDPSVTQLRKMIYLLAEDKLEIITYMATTTQTELVQHLKVHYKRKAAEE